MLILMKNITNNIMYTVQKLHNHLELNYKPFHLNVILSR